MTAKGDVAIVGMACLFPGAADLAQFARNLHAGVDAISDVPAGRWDPVFYDPLSKALDRFYCKRGGFVDAHAWFDAVAHGVMPIAAEAAEPDQLLALEVAHQAFADSGLDTRDFDRRRAGVILGRGSYPGAGRARLDQHVRGAEQLVRSLRRLVPSLDEAALAEVKRDFQAQLHAAGPDAAIGLVPNLAASRIAHRLDLQGPAWTVDAACASALIAVEQAVGALRERRLDLVLCGGVHFCQDEAFWSVFTQLGALSRSQSIRPFSARADGLLIGEGAGIVALVRREDAERMGLRSYAWVRGVGSSSDGRGASLMSPAVEGQVAALTAAWRDAECVPTSVGMIEAHGTATPAGDGAELETLRRVFGEARGERAALGSVKSMIGHAMPAAGAAGLIKAALALHQQTLFPSLHCEEPSPALAATRFRVPAKAEPWTSDGPRRAGVNAFGFGGINAHVVLEEAAKRSTRAHASPRHDSAASTSSTDLSTSRTERFARAPGADAPSATSTDSVPGLLLVAAADPRELLRALEQAPAAALARVGSGAHRIAIVDPTPARIAKARQVLERGKAWRGRDGIYFGAGGNLAQGGVAFLYPGIDGAQRSPLTEVAAQLGQTLGPEALTGSIEHQGIALVESGRLLTRALVELGVQPVLALGHSVGEWSAMAASGMVAEADVRQLLERAQRETLEVPGVAFAAVGASAERAEALLEGLAEIAVSHDNCPHQIILCGVDESIDEALRRARLAGLLGQKLPFRSGFHSPLFAPHLAVHQSSFEQLALHPPAFPLWSATTCAPYPRNAVAIRALALRHLVEPVRFRALVRRIYESGTRLFVQLGAGSAASFVEDTLRGEPHAVIAATAPERPGKEQLWRVAALLFAEGLDVRAEALLPRAGHRPSSRAAPMRLALGVPLVELPQRTLPTHGALAAGVPDALAASSALAGSPLASAFQELLDDVQRASRDVLAKLSEPTQPPDPDAAAVPTGPRRIVRRLSVESHPWLLDHTFFRQPPGWSSASDRHPVVPMTTTIQMMMDEAAALAPGRITVGVEGVRALRWLAVGAPTDVTFELAWRTPERIHVSVVGYAEATVLLADAYPAAPAPSAPRAGGRACAVRAEEMYDGRWMFHGPLFQGVRTLGPLFDDGIDGELESSPTPGALLDNAGQLFGFWVMQRTSQDRLAMPTAIARLSLFGPHPPPGARLRCEVTIRTFEARRVVADLLLHADGRAWCAIEGWEDRRFESDERLWNALIWPERSLLAEPLADPLAAQAGVVLYRDTYRTAPAREQLYRRYLGEQERAEYDALSPRSQRAWLAGRIAAKDAVRTLLLREGGPELFPVEVRISTGQEGQPLASAPGGRALRISLAHKGEQAVAMAALGEEVGVDLEQIAPRPPEFVQSAFTPEELALLQPGEDRDELLARLWCVKEAVGKQRGTGLAGNPKRWPISDRSRERFLCCGQSVETRRIGDMVIAWTQR